MEEQQPTAPGNWGDWLIHRVVHPFTVFVTPTFIFTLMTYLVLAAFGAGFGQGIRSFAGVLLPLVVITFIFIFQRELLETLGRIPTLLSFAGAFGAGFLVMLAIQTVGRASGIPVTELVLSASFSLLVFSYATLREMKMLSYYYGMISGFLVYIILLGFPSLGR